MPAIDTTPQSPAARERLLAIWAKSGDREAVAELLLMHTGVFKKIARQFGLDPDDGLQEARIVAMECLKTFDPDKGYRFMTYAGRKIAWHFVRMSQTDSVVKIAKCVNAKCAEKAKLARHPRSLNSSNNGGLGYSQILRSKDDVFETACRNEDLSRVKEAMRAVPERKRAVLGRRMNGEMLQDIGDSIGVSRKRVRQIELQAIDHLTSALTGNTFVAVA